MNKNLQTVLHYHETTKHHQNRYARSLGYMDWATQPNPFREYKGTQKLQLPLALKHNTPPYHLLYTSDVPKAPLCKESISQLLQFSMAIAAWKSAGADKWAVRCNASSGNLHPTESYLILPPLLTDKAALFHYGPKDHQLELLSEFESSFFNSLPKGSFIVALSSISWREVWKYGERAFRYVQLDVGHAWQSIVTSAAMLGWSVQKLDGISDADLAKILGLNQSERFFETELPDMFLLITPEKHATAVNLDQLYEEVPLKYDGIANKLSPTMQEWDIIPAIEDATQTTPIHKEEIETSAYLKAPTRESKDVILQRRSIHVMDKELSWITKEQFFTIIKSVSSSLDGKSCAVHPVLMVHRVKEMQQGLYILIRNDTDLQSLKSSMKQEYLWEETELENLYFLQEGDFTFAAKNISCSQDIASDGAFSLGMLTRFSNELQNFGAHRYKELYWECGAIGQQLYLEATSLGLSGTGIGCFLDDMFHSLLGLQDNKFQTLYHFTVGKGFVDSRIMSLPPYGEL
ncbi:SagB/ThcOx family dehydrogenase [Sulfurimonas marina]|uniref:SagB/ThcOx family dehydrogenase n=1 Tax=Sulfurimonas marina TaxID=2590551 RepID=A0A7M3V9L3_9BACT|nr:SagB/ThcOx family dehydrogenase [Sulfurimonas marina]QOP40446.1 SagB/ThcOx family dehydrogenase [Sulfurimonas marina]